MPADYLPPNETDRKRALDRYDLKGDQPGMEFDDLTLLASLICETPVALLTIVDSDEQWFISKHGIDFTSSPRASAFCSHTVFLGQYLEVPDTRKDIRFQDNPFVNAEPSVRFYAGTPLQTRDGYSLGSLCVLDTKPRKLSEPQRLGLKALGREVTKQGLEVTTTIDPQNHNRGKLTVEDRLYYWQRM